MKAAPEGVTMPTKPHVKATQAKTDTAQHSSHSVPQRIEPLEGWTVQTSYGTLKTYADVELVRLEDVHAWLFSNGVPATDAVRRIFSPFYMACLSAVEDGHEEALDLPRRLYVLNALTFPNGLLSGADCSKVQAVRFFATAFPDLGHVRFADGSVGGLVYSIAEGAIRVWHGSADLGTDHLAASRDRQARALDEKYAIKWPKDDDLRKLLGRLAVPVETAYALWGWGNVAVNRDAKPAAPESAPLDDVETRQDKRLVRLRELGGDVIKENGSLKFKGITRLVNSEESAGATARTEKTIRLDLAAAYKRELEGKRNGHFTGMGSRSSPA